MQDYSRRSFLRDSMLSGGLALTLPRLAGAAVPDRVVRGRKLNIACVGCGGKGSSDVKGVASENIVALCDVDYNRGRGSFQAFPEARRYKDFRRMLLDMGDEIDAVTVSTPDHMHFPVAMMAMEMGKHVFVQKPIAHTVEEARLLTLAARKYGVQTQMGNQGHANEGTRLVYEWVNSGMIGPVHEVHLWTNRPIWPQNLAVPADEEESPPTLDWNLWLGVAPEHPYNSAIHPFKWRGFWDFGCGALGDMGCHIVDASFWALHLAERPPVWVEAESDASSPEMTPNWSIVTYQFPAWGEMPPCKVIWYDGNKMPPRPGELEEGRKLGDNGQLIVGEQGTIMADTYCGSVRIIPETRMREIGKPPKMLERVPGGHYEEWIRACKGEGSAGSNFVTHAGPLTEMVLLGNVAIRAGKRVRWDAETLTCPGTPQANRFLRHPYRLF